MDILLITQEPPLHDDEVVSGNAVRTQQLRSALQEAGHGVEQVWLSRERGGPKERVFRNHDELQGILTRRRPDALLVAYWELLGLLPHELSIPVVLDYVAPRTLEELYESPESVRSSLRRLRHNLGRCDLVLVGNGLQRHLLVNTLIEAGFDLRGSDPVRVVPLGAEPAEGPRSDPQRDGWTFVAGGVTWPWRRPGPYQAEMEAFAERHPGDVRLIHFGGAYRWHEGDRPAPEHRGGPVEFRALAPYREFREFLTGQAHVGVELAEGNIERRYSQSFRSLEFLRHGLPLVCNAYLPLAETVQHYDAGWVVDDPRSLERLLPRITADPAEWRRKSGNARKLVAEALRPDRSALPLLRWLESPEKAARLAPSAGGPEQPPVLGVPPLRERIRRQFGLARSILMKRLFGQERGSAVVFVTRGDLFPPDHGAAVRTLESAKALARQGIRVALVTDERKHWFEFLPETMEKRKYPFWVRLLGLPRPLVKLLHFTKDMPYSNSFLYLPLTDGSFLWRTLAAGRAVHAGVLQAEFPAYALPCIRARDALDCAVVLVEHNVEYDRIRAQVPELTEAQYDNLREIEIDLCNRSDAVVCVSENDRQKLAADGVRSDLLHTVAHGVDLAAFDAPPVPDLRRKFGIPDGSLLLVYHGTYSYPPNREAVQIFADVLLPRLEALGIDCHLLAVGRDPPASSPHPRIHLTGSVEQVAPWLKAADLSVVPLVEGGGTRMKIIDCFAARLPVVSTGKGIEGIPVVPGRQALVLDDWEDMVAAIADLYRHPEKAERLAAAGRELAESLSWDAAAVKYRSVYSSLS